MTSERLKILNWQLPDLVAFNQRVHDRVDPYWEKLWVRRATWTGLGLFTFFAAIWIYFASGLPSSESLLAYKPPLPSNVRGYDGIPVQTFARERRVELAYDEIPPLVVNAFLAAEDKSFFKHGGLDYPGLVGAVVDYTTKSVTGGRARGG
ncbi:MAG: transglycosylase domain-containing protein, partial [Sphingomicrobium sp.]